jgi:hypothetical protein
VTRDQREKKRREIDAAISENLVIGQFFKIGRWARVTQILRQSFWCRERTSTQMTAKNSIAFRGATAPLGRSRSKKWLRLFFYFEQSFQWSLI